MRPDHLDAVAWRRLAVAADAFATVGAASRSPTLARAYFELRDTRPRFRYRTRTDHRSRAALIMGA